ncbi:MAG: hypothetical protein CMF22_11325 [Idiomarinaceae bacterium]|nr:hypothetical protein [Idiomarinaceae bacterium]|tara:strand:- start:115763 stop:116503 length:741 start_codon:yes stop_codon:yes gene_type:complete
MQYKMKEIDPMFRIRISSTQGGVVYAPLPDNWGMTVGSEFTAPFDANLLNGILSKGAAVAGISKKTGMATRKMYSNPEPTEISLDLQFEAYYSAKEEVVNPVIQLMAMSLGTTLTAEKAVQTVKEIINAGVNTFGIDDLFSTEQIDGATEVATQVDENDRIMGFINFVQGPPTCTVKFGNVLRLSNCYITSVAPQFSNVLDATGMPLSATCSVTIILETDPRIDDENFKQFFASGLSTGSLGGDSL